MEQNPESESQFGDEPSIERVTLDEVKQLTLEGMVALAARSALRAQPFFFSPDDWGPRRANSILETADVSAGIAVCSSVGRLAGNIWRIARAVRDEMPDEFEEHNAGRCLAAAVQATFYSYAAHEIGSSLGTTDLNMEKTSSAAFRAARLSEVAVGQFGSVALAPDRSDFNLLSSLGLGESGRSGDSVPESFFAQPLWPFEIYGKKRSFIADRIDQWSARVANSGLPQVADRYSDLAAGVRIDWSLFENWILGWAERNVEGFEEGRGKPEDIVVEVKPLHIRSEFSEVKTTVGRSPAERGVATLKGEGATTVDTLSREPLVRVLSQMCGSRKQGTPFTLALLGDWGSGKTSLMKMLEKELKGQDETAFEFAWFKAWEYEHTDNMAAGLADEVFAGLTKEASWLERLWLRMRFLWNEYLRRMLGFVWPIALVLTFVFWQGWHAWILDFLKSEGTEGIAKTGGVVGFAWLLVLVLPRLKAIWEHPISGNLRSGFQLPKFREHLGLIPVIKGHVKQLCKWRLGTWTSFHFSPPLMRKASRRLLVFVDDLDRCSPKCVAEAFDAIRLIMNEEHVIVVIGIDLRIAMQAMATNYKEQASERRSEFEIARDYLGKIVQLFVRLRKPTPESIGKFVGKSLFEDVEQRVDSEPLPPVVAEKSKTPELGAAVAGRDDGKGQSVESGELVELEGKERGDPSGGQPEGGDESKTEETVEEIAEARDRLGKVMKDTTWERDHFVELSQAFEMHNPRQLSRLQNSYRLMKGWLGQGGRETDDMNRKRLMFAIFWGEFVASAGACARETVEAGLWGDGSFELGDEGLVDLPERERLGRVVEWSCVHVKRLYAEDETRSAAFKKWQTEVGSIILPGAQGREDAKKSEIGDGNG